MIGLNICLHNQTSTYIIYEDAIFKGTWKKDYTLSDMNVSPLQTLNENDEWDHGNVLRFYDKTPYRETKEEEEFFNNIVSKLSIETDTEKKTLRQLNYNNNFLHQNSVDFKTVNFILDISIS